MSAEKLYYKDCSLKTFTATVTGCEKVEKGWSITLDATAFYPEGGGQACDLGMLGAAKVLDVREKGENILHLCDAPLAVGEKVEGVIDWVRRFDLMQQHTGEHIVSGLLHEKFGCHNVGFHIGADVMEVDFDCNPTPDELASIERRANEVVWENLPIECGYPAEEALSGMVYRSKKALQWPVRIVRIPDTDTCACCGVHVARTGEVGIIKILSCVKFHQGVRLQMVCGERAYRYLSAVYEQARQVSQAFSAKIPQIGAAAERMNEALAAEKFRCASLQKQVFESIADSYVNQHDVLHFESSLEPGQVRELADKLVTKVSGICGVFSGDDSQGYCYCLASRDTDLRDLGKSFNAILNGRGGGKPHFQQGSVKAKRAEIETFFSAK